MQSTAEGSEGSPVLDTDPAVPYPRTACADGEQEIQQGIAEPRQEQGANEGGAAGEPRRKIATGPADIMSQRLQQPVSLESLALLYGLDLQVLEGALKQGGRQIAKRTAEKKLAVLKSIQKHLEEKRAKI